MSDKWTDRLSEYLDGELDRTEREALESHLAGCGECSAALGDLRAVVARAGSLDDRPPMRELWSGIAERIGAGARSGSAVVAQDVRSIETAPSRSRGLLARSVTLRLPQLAAAAVALIVVSGGVVGGAVGLLNDASPGREPMALANEPGLVALAAAGNLGGPRYDSAVVELEQALSANRGQLDSVTVRVIRQNLAIIDHAIGQAQQALAADPGSVYLSNHLAGTLKRKMELLRRATGLTAVQS